MDVSYRFPPRQLLVTGAAGFIGARVCKLLLDADFQVVGIDNLNDYYDVNLKRHRLKQLAIHGNFRFYRMDVEDRPALQKLFAENRFGAVINLAARAGVRASMDKPHLYMTTNAMGTLNLLEMMRGHDVKKYVLASTSSLYAGQPMPFVESMAVNQPISPYAASKKSAEVTAYTYHHQFGIDVSVLRYFTVYGPAGRPDMSPFRFINWIERAEPIQLFGDGSQQRDFTYVDDVAEGTIAALRPLGYEIINLGGSQPFSLMEMIQRIELLSGNRAQLEFRATHSTDMHATWANNQKAKRLLGWQPKVSFDEGLAKTWQWHRQYFAQSVSQAG